jgi:Na+-transporting NADH:ubiquinone oxidoreductase subunit NqrE
MLNLSFKPPSFCVPPGYISKIKKVSIATIIFIILISSGCLWSWYWETGGGGSGGGGSGPTTAPPSTTPPTTDIPITPAPTSPPSVVGSHSAFDTSLIGLLILYSLTIYFYSHRRYTQNHQKLQKFTLRFASFLTLGFAIVQLLPTAALQRLIPSLSSEVLTLLSIESFAVGENLFIALREGGYYRIIVSPYCVGWGVILNLVALILAVPDMKKDVQRMGILFGVPAVAFLNFVKVPLEGLISYYYGTYSWVAQTDVVFANGLLIMVYLIWAAWVNSTFKSDFKMVYVQPKNSVMPG